MSRMLSILYCSRFSRSENANPQIEANVNNNNAACSHEAVHGFMSKVGPACKKIAGRTIPLEVFCSMKARTFLERGRLTLPHYVRPRQNSIEGTISSARIR